MPGTETGNRVSLTNACKTIFFFSKKLLTYLIQQKQSNMNVETARPFHNAPAIFKRWSKKDDATLRRMIKQGKNSEEIATELGRTRSSIMGRKYSLGIKAKMTPARGSKMPYVAFGKDRRSPEEMMMDEVVVTTQPEPKSRPGRPAGSKNKEAKVVKESPSMGSHLDKLLEAAKKMGMTLEITIKSEKEDTSFL
jgi:hypothetical protein